MDQVNQIFKDTGMNRHLQRSLAICSLLLSIAFSLQPLPRQAAQAAPADSTYQTLPFSQDWSDIGLITSDDNWSGIPGIVGFRGDGLTGSTGTDPQTLLADDSPGVIDVNANQTNPNTFTSGGVTEFHLVDPTLALAGSNTADAPYILIYLNTIGWESIGVQYTLRDLDGSADNAVQPVALQYRVGGSGNFTNLPAAFVADATSGPSLATLETAVGVTLPAAADNQAQLQLRIITTNAAGNDEWVGVDDLSLTATPLADAPPVVTGVVPANGSSGVAADTTLVVNFSRNVNTGSGWFSLTCNSSPVAVDILPVTPPAVQTFTITPQAALPVGASCTATIDNDQVSGDNNVGMLAPYQWSFTISNCGAPATLISAVQGSGSSSTLIGAQVTIEGVVVGDFQGSGSLNGFYLQEEDSDTDGNPATSEAVFVYHPSAPALQSGDLVRLSGTVTEFISDRSGLPNSSLTELTGPISGFTLCSSANPLPESAVIDLPNSNLERYEGMRVSFSDSLTVTEVFTLGRYSEVGLSAQGRVYSYTQLNPPSINGYSAFTAALPTYVVVLDDLSDAQNPDPIPYPFPGLSAANTLRIGDTVSSLSGVLDERYSSYRIRPTLDPVFTPDNLRPAAPDPDGVLKVASFNVLNYFNGDDQGSFTTSRGANSPAEFVRQRDKIIAALAALDADIVGLMEIENDGYGAQSAIQDLVNGLNAVMGAGTYAFIDPGTPTLGGDEITVGLLYKPDSVVAVGNAAALTDGAFTQTDVVRRNRPAFLQTFSHIGTGEEFGVVVNHFKSKGSACDTASLPIFPADPDTGDGQGNCNLTRTLAAEQLADWLETNPTGNNTVRYLVIGDLNAYAEEDPITTLEASGYTDLNQFFQGSGAYSFVFTGQSGTLDYALGNPTMQQLAVDAAIWHINADEPAVLDYNVEFKSAGQIVSLYSPDAYRASDHDPLVVGLDFYDYGDLTGYPEAKHKTIPENQLVLGSLWRAGTSILGAGTNDGVKQTPNSPWRPGANGGAIDVTVTGSGGEINAWIDWGNDGSFDQVGDQIAAGQNCAQDTTCTFRFNVPLAEGSYNLNVRVRAATRSDGATPSGTAANGEVEDYAWIVTVNHTVFLPMVHK
jgi:hypothetical protein